MGNVKQSMVIVAGLAGLMLAVAGCSGQTTSAPGAPQPSSAAGRASARWRDSGRSANGPDPGWGASWGSWA